MTTDQQPIPAAGISAHTLATRISKGDGRKCAQQHFGMWCIEPKWFRSAADAIGAGTWKADIDLDEEDESGRPLYEVNDGIAIISLDGQMTKRGSSFGGCSTVAVRDALRTAGSDARVSSIVLHICSPGGTCAGTGDLADDVNAVRSGRFGVAKPVLAYIADMGCSAAYWVASQCEAVYANSTAVVGSIGTYTVLEDDTGAQEKIGVKYRVVSTGPYKGLGADGTVTDLLVADVQREVNELNAVFLNAIRAGRGAKIADLASIADGRSWGADTAQRLGLIDGVLSLDDMLAQHQRATRLDLESQQLSAAIGSNGTPAPQAGKAAPRGDTKAADSRGMEYLLNPKKKAYLESVGLKTDATDDEATTFYNLLSPDKQAAADAAEKDEATSATESAASKTDGNIEMIAAESLLKSASGDSLNSIIVACEGDKSCAADYFLAGMTAEQAKAAYGAVKVAKTETEAAKAAQARAEFKAGGPNAIGLAGAGGDASTIADPEAKAKAEWSANKDGCRDKFSAESTYVNVRKRELAGK